MQKSDIPQALILECLSFSAPWTENMFISELDNPSCRYYAAKDEIKLRGFAGMFSVLDEGYINNIAVDPEVRRQGVGTGLINALIEHARSLKLSFLTLEVRESNQSAISLYSNLGFINVGKRRNYYEIPTEDAILMTLNINRCGEIT